jgi:hypothetical protein
VLFDFEARQHASEVGAVIAVVEQADVPAPAQLLEKIGERAGPLGKLEPAEALVRTSGACPPTMWRTCSFAISLSVRSAVSYPLAFNLAASAAASCRDCVATPTKMCA